MITYLLAWNPLRAPWEERFELQRKLHMGETAATDWGMINKSVMPGDRVFMVRLGKPPKGIIAAGSALSESYLTPHWNASKRDQGKLARCVDIAFSELLDADREPILELDQLSEPPLNEMRWTIQGSGVMMPAHIAAALEVRWQQHLTTTD